MRAAVYLPLSAALMSGGDSFDLSPILSYAAVAAVVLVCAFYVPAHLLITQVSYYACIGDARFPVLAPTVAPVSACQHRTATPSTASSPRGSRACTTGKTLSSSSGTEARHQGFTKSATSPEMLITSSAYALMMCSATPCYRRRWSCFPAFAFRPCCSPSCSTPPPAPTTGTFHTDARLFLYISTARPLTVIRSCLVAQRMDEWPGDRRLCPARAGRTGAA